MAKFMMDIRGNPQLRNPANRKKITPRSFVKEPAAEQSNKSAGTLPA
jgi:hypothetical protein